MLSLFLTGNATQSYVVPGPARTASFHVPNLPLSGLWGHSLDAKPLASEDTALFKEIVCIKKDNSLKVSRTFCFYRHRDNLL